MRWLMKRKKNVKKLLLFRVDFEKAYDFVNWNYLEVVIAENEFSCFF